MQFPCYNISLWFKQFHERTKMNWSPWLYIPHLTPEVGRLWGNREVVPYRQKEGGLYVNVLKPYAMREEAEISFRLYEYGRSMYVYAQHDGHNKSCVHLHIFKTYTHVPETRKGSKYIHVHGTLITLL
jgi:hypothetical protein